MLNSSDRRWVMPVAWVALLVGAAAAAQAQVEENLTDLPRYQAPVPYTGIRNWHVTQNLGPTGARFWVYGHRSHTRDSRELLIKSVEPGSPADGVLQPYDIIIGAAVPPDVPSTQWRATPEVKKFDADARLSIARAITFAESDKGGGALKLMRFRDGKTETVTIKLPVMGDYAATAPHACAKTDRIVTHAAMLVGSHAPAEGYFGLQGSLNALLLYATGDDRYLDIVRRTAMRMSVNHTINDAGHETWRWGYQNLFLTEYYLATGDKRVLPTIAEYCTVLAQGQCNPGTWGHRAVPDFIPPGYGSMNQSGLICFLSMVLGKQAGVEVDEQALANSVRFYGSYAGRGGIPYGDHSPHADPTCNGKNGSAAVVFGQLGADRASQWFARLCASAHLPSFEGGHTGNFFNQTWAPLGASLAGAKNYQAFWSRFNSYRDLARRWDGGFVTQPLPHTREGDLGTGNYVSKGPMWATGGYALSYLAGNRELAILGRTDSVFGGNPPEQLTEALKLYHEKKFEACMASLEMLVTYDDLRVSTLATQLQTAAKRNINSLKLTLADMTAALTRGDLYKLKWQLQAIESIIDADDPRLGVFRAAVEDPDSAAILEAGAEFYRHTDGPQWAGPLGFQIFAPPAQTNARTRSRLEALAERGRQPYRDMARAYLAAHPMLSLTADKPLFDGAAADAWCLLPKGQTPGEGWTKPGFDDSSWLAVTLPTKAVGENGTRYLRRTFEVQDVQAIEQLGLEYNLWGRWQVYLNGELVVDLKGLSWPKVHQTPLKPNTAALLKPGKNVLAIVLKPAKEDAKFKATLRAKHVSMD